MTHQPLLPGATLGVLGSGQLGRMFAMSARRLGYRVQVYSPDSDTPAGQLADREWTADYDDLDSLSAFAAEVDVVTVEFENIPSLTLEHLEQFVPVRPGPHVLHAAQNRLREKTALQNSGLPTAPFAAISSEAELRSHLEEFGGRGVLKTAAWGYDGKGQQILSGGEDLPAIWSEVAGQEMILEGFIDFQHELSVIACRNPAGETVCYDPILNDHRNHILDLSICPAEPIPAAIRREAREIGMQVMSSLDVLGVLCVEMFLTRDGRLLINEVAPRPHNSGHLTLDAHHVSQFEQQVRTICDLPLGTTEFCQPAAMANLLGDLWINGRQPNWSNVLAMPGVTLHLYGKEEAKPGRKMGHLTALGDTPQEAARLALAARESLTRD